MMGPRPIGCRSGRVVRGRSAIHVHDAATDDDELRLEGYYHVAMNVTTETASRLDL